VKTKEQNNRKRQKEPHPIGGGWSWRAPETSHRQKATGITANLHELEITFGAKHGATDHIGDPFALRQEGEAATEGEAGQAIGTEQGPEMKPAFAQ
jgi:hypothetical protein